MIRWEEEYRVEESVALSLDSAGESFGARAISGQRRLSWRGPASPSPRCVDLNVLASLVWWAIKFSGLGSFGFKMATPVRLGFSFAFPPISRYEIDILWIHMPRRTVTATAYPVCAALLH